MNNRKSFEELIYYIESHLTEKIDYKELAKILKVSEQSMQRIFIFITNMSLSEYIRKRRFSKAFEELKTTDIKIIDLAIKYQYESDISFSRGFKSLFNMTPSECRKNQTPFKQFPIYKFSQMERPTEYNYKIEEVEEKSLYAYKTSARNLEDFLYKIRELYKRLEDQNLFDKLYEANMYGISCVNELQEDVYYVGCEKELENSEKIKLEPGKYAVFDCGGNLQSNIAPLLNNIYTQFAQSTNLKININYSFEYYKDDNCYLYIKLKN